MSSLKSFLHGVAPIIGISPAALYERQRALVKLGLLTATPGRGPGSGVPFTAENVAAVIISVLAAETLSDVDENIRDLYGAIPGGALSAGPARSKWEQLGKPTFLSEVGRVLAGKNPVWRYSEAAQLQHFLAIRVTRPCIGEIIILDLQTGPKPLVYHPNSRESLMSSQKPISITAGIEHDTFSKLIVFTRGALSQVEAENEDDE